MNIYHDNQADQDIRRINNMKYLRERLGLSQDQMASFMQISCRTLQSCEAGEVEPKLTLSAMQDFAELVKQETKVDILSIPGFELSTDKGQVLFEHYEKLQLEKKKVS